MYTINNGLQIQAQTILSPKARLLKVVFGPVVVVGWYTVFSAGEQNRALVTWGQGRDSTGTSKKKTGGQSSHLYY